MTGSPCRQAEVTLPERENTDWGLAEEAPARCCGFLAFFLAGGM